jgi:HPt (histidine-containing phosphotransfer) domain-containing protein
VKSSRSADVTTDAQTRLQLIYERIRRSLATNLATIDAASRRLASGTLNETERKEAETAAHQLVGTAAMIGFPDATAPARRIEDVLGGDHMHPDDAALLRADAHELRTILLGDQRRCS